MIAIADASGKIVKQIPVSRSGSVTIGAETLHAGVYACSLYIDNSLADSKKMVVSK